MLCLQIKVYDFSALKYDEIVDLRAFFLFNNGAATKRWILQHLHHETVFAQKGGFQNKCVK